MSSNLPRCPAEHVYVLENLYLPTLSKDEEKFLKMCYYHSDREPRAVEILSKYLDRGVDVNISTLYDVTALHLVCLTNSKPNSIEIVRFLLKRGANPNNRSSNSATPLHMLVWLNHTETLVPLMSLLIEYGADVNARQENNENALHKLLRLNTTPELLRAVRLLVESGIRINENGGRVKGFGSALHILCEANQTPLLLSVAQYLVESGILVNLRDDKNNTVIHLLCRYNQTEHLLPVMRFFVEAGTDINAKNDQGQTALHVLCQYNQSDHLPSAVEYLIEQGIEGKETVNSISALSLVCKYNQTDHLLTVMNLLIPLENVNHLDSDGFMATHLCAQYQKDHFVKSLRLLAANGADLTATTSDGETILHLACQYSDQLNLVLLLPSLGRDLIKKMIDVTDVVGKTTLHYAARSGCLKTVQFLASLVDFRVLDIYGKCFVHYMEGFLTQKTTPLCLCCRADNALDLIEINILHQQLLSKSTIKSTLVPCSIVKIEKSIPRQIDHVYVFNTTDKYSRMPASNNWINLLQMWNNKDKQLDFEMVTRVASTGLRCGRSCVYRNCVWCNLLLSVNDYIHSLIKEVEKLDERFATQRLIFYGSSAERTKLFQLDEFDFLAVLSHFAEEEGHSGHVVYCGSGSAEFLSHGDGRNDISSGRAIYYFYQLLRAATKRVNCSNIHVRDITFGETCTTLHLTYCGYGQVIPISIDVTVGIGRSSLSEFENKRKLPPWCHITPSQNSEASEYLVPFRDKCGPPEWRVSYPTLERDTILRSGDEVRMCYRILKLLVILCQPHKPSKKNDEQQWIPQKTKPSSYCIKTCLFRFMAFNSPPWKKKDIIYHCIGTLEVFITHPGVHLKSFINPELNVAYIDHEALAVCSQICDRLRSWSSVQ